MDFWRKGAKAQRKAKAISGKGGCPGGRLPAWILLAGLLAGCAGPTGAGETALEFRAEVVRVELEGGFWGLVAEDGRKYDPGRLAPEYRQAGLKVTVRAERAQRVSFRQWGAPVEIVRIERAPTR